MAKRTSRARTENAKTMPMRAAGSGPRRTCATLESYFELVDQYPEYRFHQADLEGFTRAYLASGGATGRQGRVNIPVVVHVVYRTDAENISDAQVKSQIDVLNKDFSATNTDLSNVPQPFQDLIGDSQIQFELAKREPSGATTSGIIRIQTDRNFFGSTGNPVKSSATGGADPWDTKKFLNIWVCTLSNTLLGYAQFPGGPPETDGVVVRNTAFGTKGSAAAPFNLGRTATHEVGHYLNLSHIWGENRIPSCSDSDYVDDTPNQFGPNHNKPSFPAISCNNGPDGDMFMNYMDYVDDDSMFMFTLGQVARMRAALEGDRSELGN